MSDEFSRPSYTSGVWAWGTITKKLDYIAMVGNNLSTLGVSAAQLDNGFNTISTSLVWKPTTGEFGPGFGDFENHEQLATRVGAHFTYCDESKQSQPNSEGFEIPSYGFPMEASYSPLICLGPASPLTMRLTK